MNALIVKETIIETVTARFRQLAKKIEELHTLCDEERIKRYLDNQDVCIQLNISKHILQNYRDTGKLPYTHIEKKIYYRTRDILNYLNEHRQKKIIQWKNTSAGKANP